MQARESSRSAIRTQTQGSELAHPEIQITCKWLGCVMGPVLLTRGCRITMTQGNHGSTEESR